MYPTQILQDGEDTELNAEALQEIHQLQESIIETLRNELKKLKEPEVMGASNTSTPVLEIPKDPYEIPSLQGSAVYLLKPNRVFSPVSQRKGGMKKYKNRMKKSSTSTNRSSIGKYDYRIRNYPRPWADAPCRKRTISTESLEVHVTLSSHCSFSDMSVTSQAVSTDNNNTFATNNNNNNTATTTQPKSYQTNTNNNNNNNYQQNEIINYFPNKQRDKMENNLVQVESSELWKKSTIFVRQPCKEVKVPSKHHINSTRSTLNRVASKLQGHLSQMNKKETTEVNYMFQPTIRESSRARIPFKNLQKTVVFPPPTTDSKKFSVTPRKLYKEKLENISNSIKPKMEIFEPSIINDNNNNINKFTIFGLQSNIEEIEDDYKQETKEDTYIEEGKEQVISVQTMNELLDLKTDNERFAKASVICEMIYKKLMFTKSVQVTTLNDQFSQTEDIPVSLSSEFELGLFIATFLDDVVSKACDCHDHKLVRHSSNISRIISSDKNNNKTTNLNTRVNSQIGNRSNSKEIVRKRLGDNNNNNNNTKTRNISNHNSKSKLKKYFSPTAKILIPSSNNNYTSIITKQLDTRVQNKIHDTTTATTTTTNNFLIKNEDENVEENGNNIEKDKKSSNLFLFQRFQHGNDQDQDNLSNLSRNTISISRSRSILSRSPKCISINTNLHNPTTTTTKRQSSIFCNNNNNSVTNNLLTTYNHNHNNNIIQQSPKYKKQPYVVLNIEERSDTIPNNFRNII